MAMRNISIFSLLLSMQIFAADMNSDDDNCIKQITALIEYTFNDSSNNHQSYSPGDNLSYGQIMGILVSPKWVLTCCKNKSSFKGATVSVGDNVFFVETTIHHPLCQSDNLDIALVKLKSLARNDDHKLSFASFDQKSGPFYTIDITHTNFTFSSTYGLKKIWRPTSLPIGFCSAPVEQRKNPWDLPVPPSSSSDACANSESNLITATAMSSGCDHGTGLFDKHGNLVGIKSKSETCASNRKRIVEDDKSSMKQVCFVPFNEEIIAWINDTIKE